MVDFGNTVFEGRLQPTVPVVEPVTDNSDIFRLQGETKAFDALSSGVSSAIPWFQAHFSAGAEAQKNAILNQYQQEVLLIADAVEQGLAVPAARMRLRALSASYTADNPSMTGELNTLHSQLVNTHGLAAVTVEGNEATRRQMELQDKAVAAGWQAPGMSVEEATENYSASLRDVEDLAQFKRVIERKQALRQEITEEEKFQATRTLTAFIQTGFPWIQAQVEDARARVDEGQDRAIVLDQLKATIGQKMAEIGFLQSLGGDVDLSYLTSGVDRMVKAFEDYTLGTTDAAVLTSQITEIKARNELLLRSDPEFGALLSMSDLVGNMSPAIIRHMEPAVIRMLGQNWAERSVDDTGRETFSGKPADIVGQEPTIPQYLDALKEGMTNSVNEPTPELNTEIATQITNLLRGVKSYSASTEDARDFRAVIEFFADPVVGRFAEANQAIIPTDVRDQAEYVIQEQYEKVLIPLVTQRLEEAKIYTLRSTGADLVTDTTTPRDSIEPFWDGSQVIFRVLPGYENDAGVVETINSLNSGNDSVAGPINTLIRAMAHMQGTTDYSKIYEEQLAPRIFDEDEEDTGEGEAAGSGEGGVDIDTLAGGNDPAPSLANSSASLQTQSARPRSSAMQSDDGSLDSYYKAIRAAESGGNDNARNPTSTATGRYQFLESTWNDLARRYPDLNLTDRTDPEQQERAIRVFTNENKQTLELAGVPVDGGSLYAAHFLGAIDAIEVLQAADETLVSDYVAPRVIRANSFLNGMTVGEFRQWSARKGGVK